MTAPDLRPYQYDVIAKFDAERAQGRRRIMLVAPTGAGKTIIAAEIIRREVAAYHDVVILSHRREIVQGTSLKFYHHGISHGIFQSGFSPRPLERVQVASIQTLHARCIRRDAPLPPAKLLVVDEGHHAPAATYQAIIAAYPDAVLLGLTATPCRGDGRGLGSIFETLIECPQVAELIVGGFLVKTRVYAPVDPDLRGIKTVAGDWVEHELAARMDDAKLVGDIVEHWQKYGEDRHTVCFATGVGHSIHIRDEFIAAGIRCEHIDGDTPKDVRDRTLERLDSGELQIVTNCAVLTEGWDMPSVGCAILARPTKKMGLYRQMIGRVLRPYEGKPDAIILDHSGAVFRHGFVEDQVEWTLSPDRKAESVEHRKRTAKGSTSRLVECVQCTALRVNGMACHVCGYLPAPAPKPVKMLDGELVEHINGGKADLGDPALRERWHGMLAYIANARGYKPGWIAHKYREKFGVYPSWGTTPRPISPTLEVENWVRSRMIAYARRA